LAKQYDPKESAHNNRQKKSLEQAGFRMEGLDPDEMIVARFFDWLDQREEGPFFSYLHFQGGHDPFVVPSHYESQFLAEDKIDFAKKKMEQVILGRDIEPENLPLVKALYDNRIHFVDSVMATFFQRLKDRGLEKDTMILILGDHGIEFYVKKLRALAPYEDDEDWKNEVDHPYLLVYYPKEFAQGKIVSKKYFSIDILPTLADYLSIPLPDPVDGKSFLKELEKP